MTQGKWWGGNQDGELDWAIAVEAAAKATVSSADTVARKNADAASAVHPVADSAQAEEPVLTQIGLR